MITCRGWEYGPLLAMSESPPPQGSPLLILTAYKGTEKPVVSS